MLTENVENNYGNYNVYDNWFLVIAKYNKFTKKKG